MASGCMVGPDFHPPTSLSPEGWNDWRSGDASLHNVAMRETPAPASWWTTFNDSQLNELERLALTRSPDMQTAVLRFAQSRVQRQAAVAQLGPVFNASADVNRQRESEHGASARMLSVLAPGASDELAQLLSAPFTLYQGGFDASWEPDLWGRVRRLIESGDADVEAAAATFDGVRLSIAAEVARSYFELTGVREQLRLARREVSAAAQYARLVQARAKGGVASQLDATRQQAFLSELQARVPQLLDQEANLIGQLSLLLGMRPGSLSGQVDAVPGYRPPVLPDLSLGVPSDLARRRPDVRRAEAVLHAATASIGVAVAELYPRITLGAGYAAEATQSSDLTSWSSRRWMVGASLDLPLFDRGRRRSVVVLRKLQQQEAAIAWRKTVLQAWRDVDAALSAYSAEQQRNRRLAQQQLQTREADDLARALYQNGMTSFLDALDAQRALITAQREYAQSNTDLALRLVAVYKALGGGAGD
jgi:NodT family efflux transporter outer membrane factor (OMF) lipoprotein